MTIIDLETCGLDYCDNQVKTTDETWKKFLEYIKNSVEK